MGVGRMKWAIGVTAAMMTWAAGLGPAIALPGADGPALSGAARSPAPAHSRRSGAVWVRHLNCATNEPLCAPLTAGSGAWLERGRLVCHCLLIGAPGGLMLVDTGLGTLDVAEGDQRFLAIYRWLVGPRLLLRETAVSQVRRLGFRPEAITDIAVTHLDLDHVGGLSDFPQARVHVLAPELERFKADSSVDRIAAARFAHGVRWVAHQAGPERWMGLPSARIELPGADVRLVALPGHTPGHAGVAVHDGGRWLLHAGDAYMHRGELAARPSEPAGLTLFRLARREDVPRRKHSVEALRRIAARSPRDVIVFSAHDPVELQVRRQPDVHFATIRAMQAARPQTATGPGAAGGR